MRRELVLAAFHRKAVVLALMLCALATIAAAQSGAITVRSLADAQQQFERANALYAEDDYREALDIYHAVARAGYGTREVWGNAGNSAWHLGDVGRAVLAYNRALRADPDYNQARENLESIQPATNIVEGQGIAAAAMRSFRFTPAWIFVCLAEVAFVWLAASLFLLARSAPATESRSLWWSRTAGGILFFALAYGVLLAHGTTRELAADAVVIEDKAITRQGPGEQFFQQLELPAGTVLNIRDEMENGFVRFRLLDGRSGYIAVDAIERI